MITPPPPPPPPKNDQPARYELVLMQLKFADQ